MTTNVISKGWFNPISLFVFIVLVLVSLGLYLLAVVGVVGLIILLVFSLLVSSAIRVAD